MLRLLSDRMYLCLELFVVIKTNYVIGDHPEWNPVHPGA